MITFDEIQNDVEIICKDLMKLVRTPGPTNSIAKISQTDMRIAKNLPMEKTMRELIGRMNEQDNTQIHIIEDHGNILLASGLTSQAPNRNEIKSIPIVLGAHLDEATYLISNKFYDNSRVLMPLCAPPIRTYAPTGHPFKNTAAKILGYRQRELVTLGLGSFNAIPKIKMIGKERRFLGWKYLLKIHNVFDSEIQSGDIVLQDYGTSEQPHYNVDSVINAKALDDRVGSIAVIYALKYLAKQRIPIKAVLAGDEEGLAADLSWARLIKSTYKEFCRRDVVTILVDAVNGIDLREFEQENRNNFLSQALLFPYTSFGKGGGDYALFSLLRDKVVAYAEEKGGFQAKVTTDYVSRSFDPKIMDEFPLITFLGWSNGEVSNFYAHCHMDEKVLVHQIINLIGNLVYTVNYLYKSHLEMSALLRRGSVS